MKCPRCQHENPPGSKFCLGCGTRLGATCGACGNDLPAGSRFCNKCGTPATAESAGPARFASPESYTPKHLAERILTSKAALEGERKQVTVLFADLKGSMELLADRDPEEARKLLDPVLELMMEAVHRYEGTVNQVMGDGIMALFGAPLAHEDHAVRACYAALRMQEIVKKYAEAVRRSHAAVVKIRVGLNSGEVVVRTIGSDLHMDYTAVGQTTHLAARMEQVADPGAIVITSETLALAEGYVEVTSLGPVPVKGLAHAVEIYEVTGAGSARTRLQATARRGLTRFVGRDHELEQLRRAQELAGGAHGQVAAIVGEAGVGKSRLLYELTHSHRLQGWLTLESVSVSYGKATSYLPVIDLLKGYFKIQDRNDLREIREKVTGKLLTLDAVLQPTLPALLALLDVPVDDAAWSALEPAQRRQRTLDAVKRLLLREAREQPLLLIFEDLHWIDGETQALLDGLVESLGSARLLLLVNYRPEYQHAWGSKTYYSQMRLDALPAESAGELLEALLGEDPGLDPLKQLLVRRGNPFFLEETVRTLVETKALAGERGRYRLTQPVQAIQVPSTVQPMLAARIDRLPPEDKRLLQVASVIGKDVPFALLQEIAALPDDALRSGLDHLQAAEFIYETGFYPDLAYSFKHALTHDVTYGGLLQERRRALHARIVDAIEKLYQERLGGETERLAHHAVRGEVWEKALHYGRHGGDRGAERRAYREAIAGYDQALEALSHLPETADAGVLSIDLRCSVALMLNFHGEYQKSLTRLGEAETLARRLDNRALLGRVLSVMSYTRRELGDLDGAIAAGRQGREIAAALSDANQQATAAYRLAQAYYASGDFGLAAELLRANVEALSLGVPDGSWEIASLSRAWLARVTSSLGEFAEGSRYGEEGLQLAMEEGRGEAPIIARGCLGILYLAKGDLEAAVRLLEAGRALCRAADNRNWSEIIAGALGEAYGHAGRLEEALALLEEALRAAVRRGALNFQTEHARQLSAVYLLTGRLEEAWQHACQAHDLARKQQARGLEAAALFQLGAVHAHASPPDVSQAEMGYREALALAESRGMRPLVAHCHLGLGKLYRRTGKRQEALEHLTAATTMYREMDMIYWLEQAEAEIGA
jgi:predicted ATPase/class 3 adenylate cyclase